ncbi:gliding motility-associated C-terminal domain-containing protein [Ferruginibacter sp. SUN106]|uniref:T9SS type B sorting domain-containing protein n=1 Tax=Ferruginibacter sp. SUN106 TaxID=2978348 RepID=UPI003D3610DC
MKALLSFFFLLIFIHPVLAQRGNNWVFGNKAWINFSTTPASVATSAMIQLEGSSSISDVNGNLLFYSDGVTVWNAQHQVMPNGTGLFGHFSSTQSSMIVPFPADSKRYYLFTMDVINGVHGLSYSVVNMDLDNGRGDIEMKNNFLVGPSAEKVTSVNHCNGKDVWVTTAQKNSDKFYSYLVTASGIQPPVISSIGVPNNFFSIGYLKFSPDGTKLACVNLGTGLDLFDFDPSTGLISNRKIIMSGANQQPYGVEFSPNSKVLYVANIFELQPLSHRCDVRQYSGLNADALSIIATKVELDSAYLSGTQGIAYFSALQLGPDGKVYVSCFGTALGIIGKPDVKGVGCSYLKSAFPLAAGTSNQYGLPDFNQSYFKGTFGYKTSCTTKDVEFYYSRPNNASAVKWDYGDPASGINNTSANDSSAHTFTNPGTYEVTLITFLNCRNDTMKKTIIVDPLTVNLGPDKEFCGVMNYLLDPNSGTNRTYLWQDNSTSPTLTTSLSGLYWVEVKNSNSTCVLRDSIQLNFKPNPVVQLGMDTTICEQTTLLLDAGNPGATYLWQDNSSNQKLLAKKTGSYFVKVNLNGCELSDTIVIKNKLIPEVHLGNDTMICNGMTILLKPLLKNAENAEFLWSNGNTTTTIAVMQPGNYSITVKNSCGITSDGIIVKPGVCQLYIPSAFTPNNDGKNDIFKPGYGDNIVSYSIEIYNRWGEKVFTSNQINKGWDGKFKGVLQPAGVYAWLIRYRVFNNSMEYIEKGTLMMLQ